LRPNSLGKSKHTTTTTSFTSRSLRTLFLSINASKVLLELLLLMPQLEVSDQLTLQLLHLLLNQQNQLLLQLRVDSLVQQVWCLLLVNGDSLSLTVASLHL